MTKVTSILRQSVKVCCCIGCTTFLDISISIVS